MKTLAIILGACLVALGVAGSAALVNAHRANHALREANRSIASEAQVAQALNETLRTEKDELTQKLTTVQEVLVSPSAPGKPAPEIEKTVEPTLPKAYQVPIYLGKAYLGQGWVVPQNPRLNTNTMHYAYDPVVVLNENMRGSLVVHHTNIVEREVASTYVDNNYYPPPVYYVYGGGGGGHHTNRPVPPQNPVPPKPPVPPTKPPTQPTPKFNPGNGTTTPQELGTPDRDIRTRPSP